MSEVWPPPEMETDDSVIYHYTDSAGLLGIIQSGQLRATDIEFLNDSSELHHAYSIREDVLRRALETADSKSPRGQLAEKCLSANQRPSGLYVTCFCQDDDLLTQRNTYGRAGAGFSIGFDRSKLESMLGSFVPPADSQNSTLDPPVEIKLQKVIYSQDAQRAFIENEFNKITTGLETELAEIEWQSIIFNVALGNSVTRFKHPAFESENEWRIVISDIYSSGLLTRDFRATTKTIVPFVTTLPTTDRKLPIVSVRVGPTLDQDLSRKSVYGLLSSRDYSPLKVNVKESKVPLR